MRHGLINGNNWSDLLSLLRINLSKKNIQFKKKGFTLKNTPSALKHSIKIHAMLNINVYDEKMQLNF